METGDVSEGTPRIVSENYPGHRLSVRQQRLWRATGGTATVPELFAEQVARTPDALAVSADDGDLTFRELDRRVGDLAWQLRRRGVGPETVVAVRADHSAALVVALLAVLAAGGAFAPVEPSLPQQRVHELLEQLSRPILLTDARTGARLGGLPGSVVTIPDVAVPPAPRPDRPRVPHGTRPENLAYVMFTSGSTGTPKGVMISHRAVVNYLTWSGDRYGVSGGAGTIVHSSITFDLTVTSLFGPLLRGRPVRLRRAWKDLEVLGEELSRASDLSLIKITPSHLKLINTIVPAGALYAVTGALVVGGEALDAELVAPWRDHAPKTRVFNEYGPTEATVGCCVYEVPRHGEPSGSVPIGKPAPNSELHLLDATLRPVPVGVPGELYIGGICLARGYLNQPGLTAERFVANPFAGSPGRRLYRTGDLACLRPDGHLRYLGRIDEQVKIRGVRVEPAEIRASLLRHPVVRDAVPHLVDDPERGQFLAAYLVAAGGGRPADVDLRLFLARRLPEYMVPEAFVWLDRIPLTGNGKVDRRALPPVPGSATRRPDDVKPPRNDLELRLVHLFEELLGTAPIGVDDDFFDLGGHSLLAVRLIAKINAAFQADLPVSALFARPSNADAATVPGSPGSLALLLRDNAGWEPRDSLVPLGRPGTAPPLFCVPPAGGEVIGFRDLALAAERPLYALQAPPAEHPDTARGIESLAARYVPAVRGVWDHGPYLLLGWSMGGLVALEMAHRLHGAGQPVCLALVESYPAEQLPDLDEAGILAQFAEEVGTLHGVELSVPAGDLRGRPAADAVHEVLARAAAAGLASSTVELQDLRDRLGRYRAHLRAAYGYTPAPARFPVVLIQASDQPAAMRESAAKTWRALCDDIRVRVLDGDHFSIMRQPNVGRLVRILAETAFGW